MRSRSITYRRHQSTHFPLDRGGCSRGAMASERCPYGSQAAHGSIRRMPGHCSDPALYTNQSQKLKRGWSTRLWSEMLLQHRGQNVEYTRGNMLVDSSPWRWGLRVPRKVQHRIPAITNRRYVQRSSTSWGGQRRSWHVKRRGHRKPTIDTST
jgi:hypothetical protein